MEPLCHPLLLLGYPLLLVLLRCWLLLLLCTPQCVVCEVQVWHVAASDKLSALVKSWTNVLAELYILGPSYADPILNLTLRAESIGVEVVLDFLFSTFFLLCSFS